MTTFIKAIIKNSDGQTNIDKYKVAANEILQNIISKQKIKSLLQNLKKYFVISF